MWVFHKKDKRRLWIFHYKVLTILKTWKTRKTNQRENGQEKVAAVTGNSVPSEGILPEILTCLCRFSFVSEQEEGVAQVEHLNEHQQVQTDLV